MINRVLIIGDHPWTGHVGTMIGTAKPSVGFLATMAHVRLDGGGECYAEAKNLRPIDEPQSSEPDAPGYMHLGKWHNPTGDKLAARLEQLAIFMHDEGFDDDTVETLYVAAKRLSLLRDWLAEELLAAQEFLSDVSHAYESGDGGSVALQAAQDRVAEIESLLKD